jgi:hypothetical protein
MTAPTLQQRKIWTHGCSAGLFLGAGAIIAAFWVTDHIASIVDGLCALILCICAYILVVRFYTSTRGEQA